MKRLSTKGFLSSIAQDRNAVVRKFAFIDVVVEMSEQEAIDAVDAASELYLLHDYRNAARVASGAIVGILRRPLFVPRLVASREKDRLEAVLILGQLLDKTSHWLGAPETPEINTRSVFSDLRRIHLAMGDRESAASLYSALAYSALREGDVRGSLSSIQMGLEIAARNSSKIALLGAKETVARSLHLWPEAESIARRLLVAQETEGGSEESLALIRLGLGQSLTSSDLADNRDQGLELVFRGLEEIERSGHPGFIRIARRRTLEILLTVGGENLAEDIAVESMATSNKRESSRRPESTAMERLTLAVRGDFDALFLREVACHTDKYLVGAIEASCKHLVRKEPLRALESLCIAAEIATERLVAKSAVGDDVSGGKFSSLSRKARLLADQQILSASETDRMLQLAVLRNRLFHGKGESARVRLSTTLRSVAEELLWLERLVVQKLAGNPEIAGCSEIDNLRKLF